MNLREATPADVEAIRAVHYEAITGLGPAAYDEAQVAAWAEGCAVADYSAVGDEGVYFVVAEDERGVLAFGSLRLAPRDDADADVTAVYVHPSVAREGVGSAVLEALERRTHDRGAETLALTASLNAVPFYEARGYRRVGERDHEFSASEDTGVTGRVVEMQKGP